MPIGRRAPPLMSFTSSVPTCTSDWWLGAWVNAWSDALRPAVITHGIRGRLHSLSW